MSNFTLKAIYKPTGEVRTIEVLDDCWGKHHYGYRDEGTVYDQAGFENMYKRVEEDPKAYATQLLQEILDEMPDVIDFRGKVVRREDRQTILNKAKRERLEVKEK